MPLKYITIILQTEGIPVKLLEYSVNLFTRIMNLKTEQLLKVIEQASGIPEILNKKEELDEIIAKFTAVEEYLKRFGSLEELTEHFKSMEDMLYVCKEFLTTNEAVKYLSICKFTLLEAVRRREIPYYTPPSKTYYFAKADLDAWVNGYRVPTQKEMDETLEKQFKHFKPSNKRYRKE